MTSPSSALPSSVSDTLSTPISRPYPPSRPHSPSRRHSPSRPHSPSHPYPPTGPIAVVGERLPWKHTFISLRVHNFRLFAISHLIAVIAVWMQRISQDWLVLQLSGSVAAVGVTVALQFLPVLVLGPWGGLMADRFSKRRLLQLCQAAAGLCAATLGTLALTHSLEVWHVYAVAVLLGLVTVLDQPSRQVFVNELVGPEYLRNAISVNSTTFQLGGLIGPAVAGALLSAVGGGWAFVANACACLVTVSMLSSLRAHELVVAAPTPKSKGMLREAVRYAWAKPTIRWPWVLAGAVAVFALSLPVLLAAYADHIFSIGAGGYGMLNTLVALGSLAGAIASARRRRLRLATVVVGAGAYGLLLAAAAFVPSLALFGVLMALAGFGALTFLTSANQLVQTSANMGIRGRVMSLYTMVLMGGQALGGPMLGGLAEVWGAPWALFLGGAMPALVAAGLALWLWRRRAS